MKIISILEYVAAAFSLCLAVSCTRSGEETAPSSEGMVIASSISNQRVKTFAEDSNGHIWMGTFRGLNKFDVHEYHQYFCTDDTLGLPDNQINVLYNEKAERRLWISTVNGTCYRGEDGLFHRVAIRSQDNNITQILGSRDGTPLFCNSYDLMRYNPDTEALEVVVGGIGQGGAPILNIAPDGRIWAVYLGYIRSYDPVSFSPSDSIPTPHTAYHAAMTPGGELWMSGLGSLSLFDTKTGRFLPLPQAVAANSELMASDIDMIFAIDDYSILFNTIGNGVFYYYKTTGSVYHQGDPLFPFDIPDFRVISIFRDSSHNLWIGSQDEGYVVSYMNKDQFNSDRFLTDFFRGKPVISVMCDREGNLWVSTMREGIFLYDASTHKIRKIDSDHLIDDKEVGYLQCDYLMEDSEGYLWLTFSNKLRVVKCSFDGKNLRGLGTYYCYSPFSSVEVDPGDIWIGGLDTYRVAGPNQLSPVPTSSQPGWSFTPTLLNLGGGRLLVGSFSKEPTVLDTRTCEFAKLGRGSESIAGVLERSVYIPSCLFRDSSGKIWIGTVANGLIRYDDTEGRYERMEGTPCSDICSVLEDRQGNIWVSTMNGIAKYDRTVGEFTNYFEADGIGGDQFYDRASCMMEDGTIVLGGTHGLTVFNPLDAPTMRNVPVVFEDLKIHNVLVLPREGGAIEKDMNSAPPVLIRPEQNGFSISFAALDYSEHERTRYFYKMEGFDSYWVDAGYNHEAYYANLPAGRYTFKVRVRNNNNSIAETESSIPVRVLPYSWRSWWAYLLYAVGTLLVIAAIYQLIRRLHKVRSQAAADIRSQQAAKEAAEREREEEKRIKSLQMNYFSNVAHEFRTPLTMISGPLRVLGASSKITGEDKRLLDVAAHSSEWMLSLVNQLLDFNRIENDKLQTRVRKQDVVGPLRSVGEMFLFNAKTKGIDLTLRGLEDSFVMWVDEDKVRKIVTNLLSNAFKYTPQGGNVSLSFDVISREEAASIFQLGPGDTDTQYACIKVSDTGRGIPEDQREKIFERFYQLNDAQEGFYNMGSGIGLFYSRALASLHHGYIRVDGRDDGRSGSVFTMIIPVSSSSYTEDEKRSDDPSQNAAYPISSSIAVSTPMPEPVPSEEGKDERKTILVVDDDIDMANYVRLLLRSTYRVLVSFDAESALRSAKENTPDLIISDVAMPGGSGYSLCRAVKADPELCHMPVVLVTAKVAVENQVEGLDSGADAYVAKPFDPTYLQALLKSILENREKLHTHLGNITKTEEIDKEELLPSDREFLKELYEWMEKELSNPEIDIIQLTSLMRMSRTKFYYKVKALTGENPGSLFRRYKLNMAAKLLLEGKYTMSEVADMTGFSTSSHFSASFKKQFGVPPSDYRG